jgi:hypothetical protein
VPWSTGLVAADDATANTLVLQDERIRVRTLFYTVQAEYVDVLQSWERSGKRFGRVDGQLLLTALRPAFQRENRRYCRTGDAHDIVFEALDHQLGGGSHPSLPAATTD